MLAEMRNGIYNAIDMKDAPLLVCDLEEPKERPAFKIFLKPTVTRQNADVIWTEIEIMILYYCRDYKKYYEEEEDMTEYLRDKLMRDIVLENGIALSLEELEFETEGDLLAVYTSVNIDDYIESKDDAELMMELELAFSQEKS